jgi:hypothetical protein
VSRGTFAAEGQAGFHGLWRPNAPTREPAGGDWSVHPAARLGVVASSGFHREAGKVALQGSPFCISSEGAGRAPWPPT